MLNFRAIIISIQQRQLQNKFGFILYSQNELGQAYAGTITNLQIVFNSPKNPYLNRATQKILAKTFLPKNPQNKTFNPPPKKIPLSSLLL